MPNVWIVLLALIEIALFCPPAVLNQEIIADFMKLVPQTPTQTNFIYPFLSPFQQVPQVAVGISSLTISGSASTSSFSAFVVAYASNTALQVRSSPQHSLWDIRHITILASIHPELLLDTVSAQILSKSAVASQQELVFKLNQPNTLIGYQNLIVRTFLAGLSTNNPLSFLQLANSTLNGDHLTVICLTKEIVSAQVWISMVALPLQSSSFAVYGGIATVQILGIRYQDLFKMFAAPQRQFFGINAFSLSPQATFQSTEIQATIDSNFILEMEMKGQPSSFQLSYLFLGVIADQICSACAANGQGNIYSDGQCVQQCPPFRVRVSYGRGEVCRLCPSSMGLGFQNGGCVMCGNGMIARDGLCVSNQTNQSSLLTQSQINQMFQPQVSNPSVVGISSADGSGGSIYVPGYSSRCPLPYMYFNGEECLCMVGYTLISSICIKIPIDGTIIVPIQIINNGSHQANSSNSTTGNGTSQVISQCTGPNYYFNGEKCVCSSGYFMVNGNCTYCPANSQWNGQFCSCNSGYYLRNGNCISTHISNCPDNSINNGLGVCICTQPNHQLISNICQPILCPSPKNWNGVACVCSDGFITQSDGSCQARCTNGTLWIPNNQSCLVVCGVNSMFDAIQQQCRCIPGFGIGPGRICQQCTTNYYQLNGYCVTCPMNSFQSAQGLCQCQQGYAPNIDGTCRPKCGSLEEYNLQTTQCDCRRGLARVNGACTTCPIGTYLVGQACSNCPANAFFTDGRCLCNSGFIFSSQGRSCIPCMGLPNTFVVNGFCATCPGDQVYNSQSGQCSCPVGLRLEGSRCIQRCQGDQIVGTSNLCYSCPANMVFSNGQCICMQGYVVASTGCGCVLRCQSHQFVYMGRCAQCPLGMIYSSLISGCICPEGFYWSSVFNICQRGLIAPASCSLGQFLQNATQTCQACPQNCYNCTSSGCIMCNSGYQMSNGGVCLNFCGDGMIVAGQQCDTGSTVSLGCVNCAITQGYTCAGQPSICTAVATPQPPPVVVNNSLSLQGNVSINTNNVYVTLKTTPTFTFSNQNDMMQFIQANFPNSYKPAVYCMQRLPPNLDLFDCLLVYPSGVPNGKFIINFSYNYQGRSASTTVNVDSLASVLTAQSRARAGF